jgi:hypothetical protein
MNGNGTLYLIHAAGSPLLILSDAHGIDMDLPLGCTRNRAQAERWADEARTDGYPDAEVIELAG